MEPMCTYLPPDCCRIMAARPPEPETWLLRFRATTLSNTSSVTSLALCSRFTPMQFTRMGMDSVTVEAAYRVARSSNFGDDDADMA